jgi:rod shape determining protein RodA
VNLRSPLDYLSVFKVTTRERWDVVTPLALAGLSLLGVAFIYSAQFSLQNAAPLTELTVSRLGFSFTIRSPALLGLVTLLTTYWIKQLIFLVLGAGVYLAASLIDYRFWVSIAHWLYLACLLSLVLVLVIGHESGGSQRWISFGLFAYQPSETAKVSILLIVASILIRSEIGTVRQSLGVLGKLALAVGVPMLLILLQPDLKSAIVLPPMVFSMLYISKLSARFFAGALGVFLLIVGLVAWDTWRYVRFMEAHNYAYSPDPRGQREVGTGKYQKESWLPYVHDYQRNRLLGFVDPEKYDPLGIGWNRNQSLISVGSGGLAGKGWTRGTQAQLGYLPRSIAHTDFIFSVIAEEKGFLGSLTVLGLFGIVLFNGIRIAGLARDRLGTLLAIGVTVLFAVHVFVNIAMTIGLVPITGIPLPFVSYGGSFVLSCCLLQGLVQSVYRFRKDFT